MVKVRTEKIWVATHIHYPRALALGRTKEAAVRALHVILTRDYHDEEYPWTLKEIREDANIRQEEVHD